MYNLQRDGNSLIKRRRRKELKIFVDPSSHNGLTDMGPPEDTPHRVFKFKGMRENINGPLESPLSLEKHVIFHDFPLHSDTPGRLMQLDPPLSKPGSTLNNDSLKFDFDEVVRHFPSPRIGQSGSSPHRSKTFHFFFLFLMS